MLRKGVLLPCVLGALFAIQAAASASTQPRTHVRRQDNGLPTAQEILDALTPEEKQLLIDSGYDTNNNKVLEVAEIQAILDATNDPYNNAQNSNNNNNNVGNDSNGNNNNNSGNDPIGNSIPNNNDPNASNPGAGDQTTGNIGQTTTDPNAGLYASGSDPSAGSNQGGVINYDPTAYGGVVSSFNSDGTVENMPGSFNAPAFQGSPSAALPVSNLGGNMGSTLPISAALPAQGVPGKGKGRVEAAIKKIGSTEAPAQGVTRSMSTVDLSTHLQQFPKAGPIPADKPLKMGETLEGPCKLTITIQKDQNMVITDSTGRVVWQTKTANLWPWATENDGLQLRIHNGNLQMWSPAKPLYDGMWSASGDQKGTKAMLGPDGNLILVDDLSSVLWSSGLPKEDLCTDKKAEVIKQQMLAGVALRKH
eukprot:comp5730_c0_seq1/m.1595 comp5730_c0_seq1/g.1595  ORF comp5730_c0_seq1/g.1595 comp5730_c0_seq1/m.1595 type:complete len:421 (-) comp5730_c0_seq1:208-1470(-)